MSMSISHLAGFFSTTMNTANTSHKPHPHLKKPVIFIQKVPATVHKEDLFQLFRKFQVSEDATITLTKASTRRAKAGEQVARVEFSSLDSAQKAMALLQHEQLTPHSNFPRCIYFALSKNGSPIKPSPAPLPRLFKYQDLNASRVYDLLRPYGPIFSLKVEEEYGTVSVVFWKIEDMDEAVISLDQSKRVGGVEAKLWSTNSSFQSSEKLPSTAEMDPPSEHETGSAPILPESNDATAIPVTKSSIPVPSRPVTTSASITTASTSISQPTGPGCTLFCIFLPVSMDVAGFQKLFSKFGDITSAEIHNQDRKRGYSHGLISFKNREDGLRAIDAMNGLLLERRKIVVRMDRKDSKISGNGNGNNRGSERTNTEESLKSTEPVHPSNDNEWHGVSEERASSSPQTSDIHADPSVVEPETEATSFSPSDSETTLVGSSTIPLAEDTSSRPSYSKVAQADPPQFNFQAPENSSSILDDDTAKNLASLVSNIWKEEAGKLRAELVDLRVREGRIAEELEDSKAQESRIAKELNDSRARERRIAEELENEKVKREEESREAQEEIADMRMTINGLEWENEYLGKEKLRLQRQLDIQFEEKVEAEAMAKEMNRLREELTRCEDREFGLMERAENLVERLQEAKEREAEKENTIAKLERQFDLSENKIAELERQLELSESRRKILELEADKPKWEEARKKREKAEKEEEERTRQRDLEKARQRMKDMQQKEKEAKEAARLEKQKEEERRKREEAERKREEEEQKRREEERRKREEAERKRKEEQKRRELEEKLRQEKAWREATAKEVERCRTRDRTWTPWILWGTSWALDRFKLVMNEFETQKFSSSCPMVLLSIPWPVLDHPSSFKLEQVQWDAVEKFFNAVQKEMSYADYKALVERAHKMFHPDRWRSRNVLSSVMDVEERDAFEKAGNRVSQAITPIWRNLRR
ncbi:hypothetical protein D9758_009496 [Tetrapyrgos nigripes]|uniref:RRM domain-containing protein n=1 Tax=Tetrapyrgos nigripes TaxID=182062 RepID=A0A8H5G176_9AGAR|nr:hypothetical protein D9758_009496 [Tetrapyrgos nigripes]